MAVVAICLLFSPVELLITEKVSKKIVNSNGFFKADGKVLHFLMAVVKYGYMIYSPRKTLALSIYIMSNGKFCFRT